MARVVGPDVELFLTRYVRSQLRAEGIDAEVSNKEPRDLRGPLARPLIVIRDDSGPGKSQISSVCNVGISVLGGSPQDDHPVKDLARLVNSIVNDDAIVFAPGSPIAAVDPFSKTGPIVVDDPQNIARVYSTASFTVVGSWK